MKNIEYEITFEHGLVTETSQKNVEVTEEFEKQIKQFNEDVMLYYRNNPNFPITELTEIENNHLNNNGYPPETEKIHEYAQEKIMQIANDKLFVSYPYTYVDEFNEYGGDEFDLVVAGKLDVRYYEHKAIIDDIINNNLQSNIWQILDNKTKGDDIEGKLSKSESNTIAAMIIFDELFYNLK